MREGSASRIFLSMLVWVGVAYVIQVTRAFLALEAHPNMEMAVVLGAVAGFYLAVDK